MLPNVQWPTSTPSDIDPAVQLIPTRALSRKPVADGKVGVNDMLPTLNASNIMHLTLVSCIGWKKRKKDGTALRLTEAPSSPPAG
jgi:hypothetical protein